MSLNVVDLLVYVGLNAHQDYYYYNDNRECNNNHFYNHDNNSDSIISNNSADIVYNHNHIHTCDNVVASHVRFTRVFRVFYVIQGVPLLRRNTRTYYRTFIETIPGIMLIALHIFMFTTWAVILFYDTDEGYVEF